MFKDGSSGYAVGAFAPLKAQLDAFSTLDIDTTYPFEDTVRFTFVSTKAQTLKIRIPAWATKAQVEIESFEYCLVTRPQVTVNQGTASPATAGTMHTVSCAAGTTSIILALNPEVRVEHWSVKQR